MCQQQSTRFFCIPGQAGGNHYTHKGGGVNYLCLPNNPENGEPFSAATNQIFGAEYELASSQVPSGMKNQKTLHNKEVPCTVCYQRKRSTVLMIPGNGVGPVRPPIWPQNIAVLQNC